MPRRPRTARLGLGRRANRGRARAREPGPSDARERTGAQALGAARAAWPGSRQRSWDRWGASGDATNGLKFELSIAVIEDGEKEEQDL